ncbi:tetraacyldisaccharide 4'-kinase [uncultured Cocleimonas sp.]|uniref:tetraacyldisaccharide 4'-kinase n=1 Tax=uncultured Cocleimonas sp. TaxID=1051587 RepID=UPI00261B6323|nr:tetraacyldisaccharide 4'-kinase [uncultured Cocleimonas sp.]
MSQQSPDTSQNQTTKLQQWLERVWYKNGKGRFLLMPLSALYCAANAYQRKTQLKALSQNPPIINVPIIVVGNITVGGTGKTPVTVHIVNLLKKSGYKPAIITRGYGGKAQSWPQKVTADSDAELIGDEAVLMATRTGVPVYAGANRLESIQSIQADTDCDVIVSDDGMQHYKMPRDIQIAVVDGERGFGNQHCIPAGPLREKLSRLDSCDLLVLNGENKTQNTLLNQFYMMSLSGNTLVNLATEAQLPLTEFSQQKVDAVTGIGNPKRFYSTLEDAGLVVNQHSFPDHYAFTKNDLLFANDSKVIMTEKDAVKCKNLVGDHKHFWYLPISAVLPQDFDDKLLVLLSAKGFLNS